MSSPPAIAMRELEVYLGKEAAEALLREVMAEAGLSAVNTADDLVAIAELLTRRRGVAMVVGRLLKLRALKAGADLPARLRTRQIHIGGHGDRATCVTGVSQLAAAIGFPRVHLLELEQAVALVVDNVLRYAGAGELNARVAPQGIRIEVWDRGPGIPMETQMSIKEGVFRSRADPSGLVRVRKLLDRFSLLSFPGHTQILMAKDLPVASSARA